MKTNLICSKSLVLAALVLTAGLQACGGDDAPLVPPPGVNPSQVYVNTPGPQNLPFPTNGQWNSSYVNFGGSYLFPQLQAQLGNVIITAPVVVQNITIPPGSYGWDQLYTQFIYPIVTGLAGGGSCGCYLNSAYSASPTTVWANLNYQGFAGQVGQYYSSWQNVIVQFTNMPGYNVSFYQLLNMIVAVNQVYYSQVYYAPTYYTGGYYQPSYWNPNQNNVNANLYYNNGNGFQINVGGFFGWN